MAKKTNGLSEAVIQRSQTIHWQKEQGQNDKQQSTKHYTEH
jgi:hypothetical protein